MSHGAGDRHSEARFTAPHSECPEPELWSSTDEHASEREVTDFVGALVELVKPRVVVETGTWHGATTVRIAEALRANGRGRVYGIELEPASAEVARAALASAGLDEHATVVVGSSLSWSPPGPVDLLFVDSGNGRVRAREVKTFRCWMSRSAVICIHDTARANHREHRLRLEALVARGVLSGIWMPTPRGLFVGQPRSAGLLRRLVGVPLSWSWTARAVVARLRSGRLAAGVRARIRR